MISIFTVVCTAAVVFEIYVLKHVLERGNKNGRSKDE